MGNVVWNSIYYIFCFLSINYTMDIILASQSPRRKHLLESANINFSIVTANTAETFPSDLSFEQIPIHIAKEKANVVFNKNPNPNNLIIAADTIVVLDDKILGKPKDKEEAISFLHQLSGNTHQVITGVVLLHHQKEISFIEVTEVDFHPLTSAQIEFYVNEFKPYDKAGAYAIQEWIGLIGIKRIVGDFYNVMGLPISKVVQAIEIIKKSS